MTKQPWLTRTIALTLKGYKWQGGTAIVVDRRTARCDHVKAAACLWCLRTGESVFYLTPALHW